MRTWLERKLTDIKSVICYFHVFYVGAQKVELARILMNNSFFKLNEQFSTILLCSVLLVKAQHCAVQLCATKGNLALGLNTAKNTD